MKVKVLCPSVTPEDAKIFLDNKEITDIVSRLNIDLRAGETNYITLVLSPDEIEVEMSGEVKKVYLKSKKIMEDVELKKLIDEHQKVIK